MPKKRIIFWLNDCPYNYRGRRYKKTAIEKGNYNKFLEFRSNYKIIRDFDTTRAITDIVEYLDNKCLLTDDVLIESYSIPNLSFDLKMNCDFEIYIGRWFKAPGDITGEKYVCGILELKEHMDEIDKDLREAHNLERLTTGHTFDGALRREAIKGADSKYYSIIYNAMKEFYKKKPERKFRKLTKLHMPSLYQLLC